MADRNDLVADATRQLIGIVERATLSVRPKDDEIEDFVKALVAASVEAAEERILTLIRRYVECNH